MWCTVYIWSFISLNHELDLLKEKSINSHNLWKSDWKPSSDGPCFSNYHSDQLTYKLRIQQGQKEKAPSYTNDLHEAWLSKEGNEFWKCWRSKLGHAKRKPTQVDGQTRDYDIANLFSSHLQNVCRIASAEGNIKLLQVIRKPKSVL